MNVFFTTALDGGKWSASHLGRFIPEERTPVTHWIGDSVGPKARLEAVERRKIFRLPGLELRPLGYPDRSQSLYRRSCRG
jgi:hypothetical protein